MTEPAASRDHTERMLLRGGVDVRREGLSVSVGTLDELELEAVHVPGDPSSAAFHAAAAVLVPGSRIVIEGMLANWTRVGFFRILERMGGIVVGPVVLVAAVRVFGVMSCCFWSEIAVVATSIWSSLSAGPGAFNSFCASRAIAGLFCPTTQVFSAGVIAQILTSSLRDSPSSDGP